LLLFKSFCHQYNIAPHRHLSLSPECRAPSLSMCLCPSRYLRCSSTILNHLFLGLPCRLFPGGFYSITDLTVLLSLLLITCPSHYSLCQLIKLVTGATSTVSTYRIVSSSPIICYFIIDRAHTLLYILFSNVLNLLFACLVVVHTAQPYVKVGLIIAMYSLTLVFLERGLDPKNFANTKYTFQPYLYWCLSPWPSNLLYLD